MFRMNNERTGFRLVVPPVLFNMVASVFHDRFGLAVQIRTGHNGADDSYHIRRESRPQSVPNPADLDGSEIDGQHVERSLRGTLKR
jgi:hypothetical protein